jgi:hypothetical protein
MQEIRPLLLSYGIARWKLFVGLPFDRFPMVTDGLDGNGRDYYEE